MPRLIAPENDYRTLADVPVGNPRLSVAVVIPVYNRVELLRRTLAGLAAQRNYPGELMSVVVADDGSDDPIEPAVEEARAYLNVGYVRQERDGYGAGRARTLGAFNADADIVLFIDADCLPDPELIAGHMAWHHRADNLVVVGSRQNVDSSNIDPADLVSGAVDVRRLVKGDRAAPDAFAPEDWRRTFYRRTADLRHGNESFRSLLTGNCSVNRHAFLSVGGFRPEFARWGGEDTELGWRLFSAGFFFVPVNQAAIYHQGQEESHPEADWRERDRAANAELIANLIPHRFYRKADGHFEVPKVTMIVAPGAANRSNQLLSQMQAQRMDDWEVFFPLNPSPPSSDPRLQTLPDPAGTDQQRLLRAVAAASGEYVAVVSGAAALHPRLLDRSIRLLDSTPRASTATAAYDGLDITSGNAAWGAWGLPAFVLTRRREWSKVLPETASVADAWQRIRTISWPVHLEEALITLPTAVGLIPPSVLPHVSLRDRAVEAGRRSHGPRGWVYRILRRLQRRDAEADDDRPVLVYIGDDRAVFAVAQLAPWARVEPSGRGNALVLGAGAVLDDDTYDLVRALDSPRMERMVAGAGFNAEPTEEWLDFLGTCLAIGLATEEDHARVGNLPDLGVVGHPAEHPEPTAALLDVLREEIS
jgi:GT2 family glycosyltransferase